MNEAVKEQAGPSADTDRMETSALPMQFDPENRNADRRFSNFPLEPAWFAKELRDEFIGRMFG